MCSLKRPELQRADMKGLVREKWSTTIIDNNILNCLYVICELTKKEQKNK